MGDIFSKCRSALLFSEGITGCPNANFLKNAGADVDGSILLLMPKKKMLITSEMNAGKAKKLFKFRVIAVSSKDLRKFLKKTVPAGKVGLDFESISAARHLRLRKIFGKRIVGISGELEWQRAAKSREEISNIAKAVKITKSIFSSLKLKPSMSELDAMAQLELACIKNGVEPAFPPIVAAGKNSGNPHHSPTKTKFGKGMVLVDFGVKYNNYCADLTRCYFLGKCEKERKKYEEAKQMVRSIISQIPKCKTAGDIAKFYQKKMKEAKWEIIHSIGHGIGLETHDVPSIYAKNRQKLIGGMAFAIEAGWYSKEFGVRFEENIIILKNKKVKML